MGRKYDQVHRLFKSADFVEGPRAFAEKRAPKWQGR
jgi:enoyl-CoA hydratase/carnithine racemase